MLSACLSNTAAGPLYSSLSSCGLTAMWCNSIQGLGYSGKWIACSSQLSLCLCGVLCKWILCKAHAHTMYTHMHIQTQHTHTMYTHMYIQTQYTHTHTSAHVGTDERTVACHSVQLWNFSVKLAPPTHMHPPPPPHTHTHTNTLTHTCTIASTFHKQSCVHTYVLVCCLNN